MALKSIIIFYSLQKRLKKQFFGAEYNFFCKRSSLRSQTFLSVSQTCWETLYSSKGQLCRSIFARLFLSLLHHYCNIFFVLKCNLLQPCVTLHFPAFNWILVNNSCPALLSPPLLHSLISWMSPKYQ